MQTVYEERGQTNVIYVSAFFFYDLAFKKKKRKMEKKKEWDREQEGESRKFYLDFRVTKICIFLKY